MDVDIIITVLNEEKEIKYTIDSLLKQTILPKNIIVIDGGSTDKTINILKSYNNKKIKILKIIGNRSKARNIGIKYSKAKFIAITDAGCILDKYWLESFIKCYKNKKIPIIYGFYEGLSHNNLEQAFIAYLIPKKNKIFKFLPTTRSVFIDKSIFKKFSFNENLSLNEDFEFFYKLKNSNIKFFYCKNAKLKWIPPKNLKQFIKKIYNFAKGDAQARIIRPKIYLLFIRYILFFLFSVIYIFKNPILWAKYTFLILIIYALFSILKNFSYAKKSWFYLPIIQIITDFSIMIGTINGLLFTK